jgi:ADP-heptose:LPS heptosyltransferase
VVLTGGSDPYEQEHLRQIQASLPEPCTDLSGKISLATFAAVLASARLCVSTDTGALHLAAAFHTPQIALFGPTNPFHWRPRHSRARVFSAAQPEAPITQFQPRMKGASMAHIEADPVATHACELLALNPPL